MIPRIELDDILEMKKPHPCSSKQMRVLRVGSDIRLLCLGCGRDITLPRTKLEKMIRKINGELPSEQSELK
jgi:hypothetical protein